MICREAGTGIIGQHDLHDPSYLDFGDSAARTGIMAASGSGLDISLCRHFVKNGQGVRHPSAIPYNNPNNFTRDQLIQLLAGLGEKQAKELLISHAKRGFLCQNTHTTEGDKKPFWARDILTPSHIGLLILKARARLAYPILPICMAWLLLDIVWSSRIKPLDEQNQIICMLTGYPKIFMSIYKKLNKSLVQSLDAYWGGWRDQIEISRAIKKNILGID